MDKNFNFIWEGKNWNNYTPKYFNWSGKLKLVVASAKKREKLKKLNPNIDLDNNNKRYPTKIHVVYDKSKKKFLVSFKVGNETLEGEFTKRCNHTKHLSAQLDKSRLWLSKIKFKGTNYVTPICIKGDWDDYVYDFFRYWHLKLIPKKGGGSFKKQKKITKHTIAKQYSKCVKKVGPSIWQRYKYTGKPITKKTSVNNKWKQIQASNKRFIKSHKKEMTAYDKRWKRTYKKCNKHQQKSLKLLNSQTK
tara:strand:+ start:20 stop:763 length:744 start_codon:yes stop_codon:yes gene_type:complete